LSNLVDLESSWLLPQTSENKKRFRGSLPDAKHTHTRETEREDRKLIQFRDCGVGAQRVVVIRDMPVRARADQTSKSGQERSQDTEDHGVASNNLQLGTAPSSQSLERERQREGTADRDNQGDVDPDRMLFIITRRHPAPPSTEGALEETDRISRCCRRFSSRWELKRMIIGASNIQAVQILSPPPPAFT
jgi:hypothetical protein